MSSCTHRCTPGGRPRAHARGMGQSAVQGQAPAGLARQSGSQASTRASVQPRWPALLGTRNAAGVPSRVPWVAGSRAQDPGSTLPRSLQGAGARCCPPQLAVLSGCCVAAANSHQGASDHAGAGVGDGGGAGGCALAIVCHCHASVVGQALVGVGHSILATDGRESA